MRCSHLVATVGLMLTSTAIANVPKSDPTEPIHAPEVALPGFGASLANSRMINSGKAWKVVPYYDALGAVARSTPETRQNARWQLALSLIGSDEPAQAFGVLTVMAQDDPDLALVPAYRLALGASLVGLGRTGQALTALSAEQLANNPEACAWRMRALAEAGMGSDALLQWTCAEGAISQRPRDQRPPFILAGAKAALDADVPARALSLLATLPDADPSANLLRGQAYLALGKEQQGRLRLDRAKDNGSPLQRADANLSMIEWRVAHGRGAARSLLRQLDQMSYGWRGDKLEERALRLRYKLAGKLSDDKALLKAGATLFRYFPSASGDGTMLTALQRRISDILAPDSKVSLPEAAGLFWDYRDLTPTGTQGDLMVIHLADRLQAARLYKRAAELLDYQLIARLQDVAQGPLSVRVAKLYILSGEPEEALDAIRETDGNIYPDEMRWARKRIEAVALNHLGRTEEALATLEDVPDGAAIRSEIEWRRRNWKALADSEDEQIPSQSKLSEVEQTVVLRRAVSMAMLGREEQLANLRKRYAAGFSGLATEPAFDLLTSPIDNLEPNAVAGAMAAIPTASPAGNIADLLALDSAKTRLARK